MYLVDRVIVCLSIKRGIGMINKEKMGGQLFGVGDKVSIPATGRAYKRISGKVVEIDGDQIKVSLTGKAYKVLTRYVSEAVGL